MNFEISTFFQEIQDKLDTAEDKLAKLKNQPDFIQDSPMQRYWEGKQEAYKEILSMIESNF